jgi:hypothetical protein
MERFAFVELLIDPTASGVIIVPAEDIERAEQTPVLLQRPGERALLWKRLEFWINECFDASKSCRSADLSEQSDRPKLG